jgi:hypothetical protein
VTLSCGSNPSPRTFNSPLASRSGNFLSIAIDYLIGARGHSPSRLPRRDGGGEANGGVPQRILRRRNGLPHPKKSEKTQRQALFSFPIQSGFSPTHQRPDGRH